MRINKLTTLLLTLTLLSGAVLASSVVSADNDSVVDEISITVPVSCTMSGTGMNSHNAEIQNGTYTADIGTTTLHAFCNDSEGFAIYAAGYTGDEIGGTNSNKLVGTSASSNATIKTGLATSAGSLDESNWAMKLTMTQDSGDIAGTNAFTIDSAPNTGGGTDAPFSSYHVIPKKYTKVAHKNSSTDMTTNTGGVKLNTTYAAYISRTQPADTYSGQVIYLLVHPASASAPDLVACNPNGITISTIICMQDISSTNKTTVMASMTRGVQYALKDKRDGKTYTVAKLADDRVWMTQNLDLDLDSGTTYTNLDTDLGWNTSTGSYQTASWVPSRSTYETTTNNVHEWCQGGIRNSYFGYCQQNNTPESYDPGNLYWNGITSQSSDWSAYDMSCSYTTATPSCNESRNPLSNYVASTGEAQYHLGNYYNWAAAIASNDTSVYGVYNQITDEHENLEANQSICPAGWTLPYAKYNYDTYKYEGDFVNLWTKYGWNSSSLSFRNNSTLWSTPLYFAPFGTINDGVLEYVGYHGFFWSSVAADDYNVHNAYFHVNGAAVPADNETSRYGGFAVRCLVR